MWTLEIHLGTLHCLCPYIVTYPSGLPYVHAHANRFERLKWPYAIARMIAHFMCALMSDLVVCKFRQSMIIQDTECPYWDQASLNSTNLYIVTGLNTSTQNNSSGNWVRNEFKTSLYLCTSSLDTWSFLHVRKIFKAAIFSCPKSIQLVEVLFHGNARLKWIPRTSKLIIYRQEVSIIYVTFFYVCSNLLH